MTEALAELWHKRIRQEWGYVGEDGPSLAGLFRQKYRGSRYSWGYPACPDLEDQAKLVELLEVDRIGVVLTEEFQLEPEQSTSAIIVPHPEAKYFVACERARHAQVRQASTSSLSVCSNDRSAAFVGAR